MEHHFEFLNYLVSKGGPDIEDYYELDAWIAEIAEQLKKGNISLDHFNDLRSVMGIAISTETMQGFVLQKPHGYAGDFEIIDRIYTRYVSKNPNLAKWDIFMQEHAAVNAVRNRVKYLGEHLKTKLNNLSYLDGQPIQILNLASGPGRDMLRFFEENPDATLHFDCIEQDQNAVNHAKHLCKNFLHKINFYIKNALRFRTKKKYHLIWSAGLFDYFDDKIFVHMLKKLSLMLEDDGEIVIGNFSTINPSKTYMELFEWHLHHRSPNTLKALAISAGFSPNSIKVEKESTGVNLFLHINNL